MGLSLSIRSGRTTPDWNVNYRRTLPHHLFIVKEQMAREQQEAKRDPNVWMRA
jgi:hypothetical protein